MKPDYERSGAVTEGSVDDTPRACRLLVCSFAKRPLVLSAPGARVIRLPASAAVLRACVAVARLHQLQLPERLQIVNSHRLTFWLLIAFCALACVLPDDDVAADEAAVRPSDLKLGDGCVVHVSRNGVHQKYQGSVTKLNDRWLVLTHRIEGRSERRVPVLSSIPLLGRYIYRTGIARAERSVWIPVDMAVVQERVAGRSGAPGAPDGEVPRPGENYYVEYLNNNEMISTGWMKLEAVSDTTLTLSDRQSGDRREINVQQVFGLTTDRSY